MIPNRSVSEIIHRCLGRITVDDLNNELRIIVDNNNNNKNLEAIIIRILVAIHELNFHAKVAMSRTFPPQNG